MSETPTVPGGDWRTDLQVPRPAPPPHDETHTWCVSGMCWTCYLNGRIAVREGARR